LVSSAGEIIFNFNEALDIAFFDVPDEYLASKG
jgi:hypothetical protein